MEPVVNEQTALKKENLMNLDLAGMQAYFKEIGEKPFRAQQVIKWIHQHGETDISAWTNISKSLRQTLTEKAEICRMSVLVDHVSEDGTRKWLLGLPEGNRIETVYIPEAERGTLCVSSQVGCALNCQFCATATQGFNRNLTLGEIIGQVWHAVHELKKTGEKVTNVVMMGMGEPLLNYDNVVKAMNMMMHDLAYGLSKYRVTLSTSGVVPNLRKLSADTDAALAVSLHAPNDFLRTQLVPINKKYPIAELLDACKNYFPKDSKRSVTFEYVMLKDVNDQTEHAKQLVKILNGVRCKINLIPFNPFPGNRYECSSRNAIYRFRDILEQAGLIATIRKTRGEDIAAACGQLVGDFADRTSRSARMLREAQEAGLIVNS